MAFGGVEFFSAVLLVSKDVDRLAHFYREVLKFPLKDEQHGETEKHYGCELGDLHFAIHPAENFKGAAPGIGAVKLAFEIFDMDGFIGHLTAHDVQPLYAPRKMGPMLITAVRDPDGNEVEFTQLAPAWYKHLEKRRAEGHDILQRWKSHAG
ncbi:MAG: VOC family protein [Deltaproteobacteria bacterium]|nr:VOC family protein [Deltaproteobacteria bacterium]